MSYLNEPVSLAAKDSSPGGCPTVTINGPEALSIPEHFTITFHGTRGQIVARSATRHEKATASVVLHLHKMLSVEEADAPDGAEDEAGEDKNPIDKLFEQAQYEAPEEE